MLIEFFIWLIICYLFMGFAEYIIHAKTMHRRFFPKGWFDDVFEEHAILHHKHGRNDLNIDLPVTNHLLLSFPIILALAIWAPLGLIAWLIIIHYHAYSWTHCHRAIHGLKHHWLENTNYYRQIKEHHELHHDHPNKNFGVCFFFADKLFSTKI